MSLKDTLTNTLPEVDKEIASVKSSYNPGNLTAVQDVMRNLSELAYSKRAKAESKSLDKQVDPTKVSGGTFAGIMDFVENNRGRDISKVYSSSMSAHESAQSQLGARLSNLESLRDNMASTVSQFKNSMISEYPGVYELLDDKEKEQIEKGVIPDSVYEKIDRYAAAEKQKTKSLGSQGQRLGNAMVNAENTLYQARGDDGFVDPEAYKQQRQNYVTNGGSYADFDTQFGDLVNPNDYERIGGAPSGGNEFKLARDYVNQNESLTDEELKVDLLQNSDLTVSEVNSIIASRPASIDAEGVAKSLTAQDYEKSFWRTRGGELNKSKEDAKNKIKVLNEIKIGGELVKLTDEIKQKIYDAIDNLTDPQEILDLKKQLQ